MREGGRHPDDDRGASGDAATDDTAAPSRAKRPTDTRRGAGVAETLPASGDGAPASGVAETMPASSPDRTEGDTHPGAGVPAKPGPIPLTPFRQAVFGATLTGGTEAGSTMLGAMPAPPGVPIIRPPQPEQTEHGGTLQGPFKVADLPTLPRVNDDTYAIGTEIARGGMGKILAARDRRLRRDVVIKVMRRDYGRIDPRFEREALITARLQHPSIVRVYDAGVLGDGRAFYAMERVRGRSLEVVLDEARTMRERLALLPHAIAVCQALAYAHNEGVVHRDLKPSNILLGPFGETVVIDWGLAKDLRAVEEAPAERALTEDGDDEEEARSSGSALTQHGAVMGTPAFMAPEQARGELADERTDVYALGALLYTMLTGAPPVSGSSSDEVIEAVATGQRRRIAEVEPGLPPELASIVERAMAHEPERRYPSAKQLADDLESFAAGKLVPSHAYSTWQLVRRWVARNRGPVAIAGVAVVLLLGLGVWSFANIRRERDNAERLRGIAEREEKAAEEAQRKAEDQRDTLILEQAERIFPRDPSMAAAWLKSLSERALDWPQTRTMAERLHWAGLGHQLAGHRNSVEMIAASPDGVHVASASDDGTVRVWDLSKGYVAPVSIELVGHVGPIDTMVVSRDGTYLATAGSDHKVILWTLATGARRELLGHTNTVRGVAFSQDLSKLASASEDGTLYLWDVAAGTGSKLLQYSHSLRPVIWLDDRTLLVGAFDGSLGRVDIPTKRVRWLRSHAAEIRCLAISPDRSLWVATDEDGRVMLWDAVASKKLRELKRHEDVAREAIFTADGKYLVTGGGSYDVHVHTMPDGAFYPLSGNTAGVKDIDVSSDGLVASAGIDNSVHLWKLDGTLVHAWRGHRAGVKGVAFVGRKVVSGAEDKTVRVWSLDEPPQPPRGAALRGWLEEQTNIKTSSTP